MEKQKHFCRMCKGKKFKTIIDFGSFPLVNCLVEKKDLDKKEEIYPLVLVQCQKCHLVQVKDAIDANKIYRDVDYLYFSSDIPQVIEYFKDFADDIKKRFIENENDFVVEIASNDGVFIKNFKNVLGVDPASNVVLRAIKNGLPALSDFFSKRIARSIKYHFGKAKVIAGSNFIAHLEDIDDIVGGVKELLDENGVMVFECNYWGNMVKNRNFALLYHDHMSYFSLQNWVDYLPQFGLEVFDAIVTPAQGGSLRIFADFIGKREITPRFETILADEKVNNLNTWETAKKHGANIINEAKKLNKIVNDLKKDGKTIAGYGAAAKGFPVMKLAEIDERHIDFFVDDSPAKQGKYTPVSHIPVVSRDESHYYEPDYFFITASNYEDVILKKEQKYLQNGGHFITIDGRII